MVKDVQACADLFAEDAVIELPYASGTPAPGRKIGKGAIYNYVKNALFQM